MSIFYLPGPAWLVTLKRGCRARNHPFGTDYEAYRVLVKRHSFPEVLLWAQADPQAWQKDPRVTSVLPVWVLSNYDNHLWDGAACADCSNQRELVRTRMSGGKVFADVDDVYRAWSVRDEALSNLALVNKAVEWVLSLSGAGEDRMRVMARAALDGDDAALPILADWLEEQGHPLAVQVRSIRHKRRGLGRHPG
jgi:hypothetical protein